MSFLELRIPPLIVAAVVAGAMWATASVPPRFEPPAPVRGLLASLLYVAGFAIVAAGVRAVRLARTTTNPLRPETASTLVASGIYARTRNPMYLGLALLLLGWAAQLAALWPALGPLLFVGYMTRFQILPEERALATLFGTAYADYRRRVRRWL